MSAPTKGPTLEVMHATWLRRKRAAWPPTFQDAMEHPIYKRILMVEALRVELRAMVKPQTIVNSSPVTKREFTRDAAHGYWMDSKDPVGVD